MVVQEEPGDVHTRTLQREAMEEPAVAPTESDAAVPALAMHGTPLSRILQRQANLEL